jgi:hypothetical protein
VAPERNPVLVPDSGLIASRIKLEYAGQQEFAQTLERALARGGERGATIIAYLDRGDIAIHLPREDGPCWNAVPLVHLDSRAPATDAEWAVANGILEKLERYR